MGILRVLGAALAGAALIVWTQGADAANSRIALVIGESAYPDAALPTTANDAGLVAQVLQAAGFDVVGARDLDQKSIRESMRDFLDKANAAGPDMQAFVYFSGRALQYEGDNYLAPIDARIARGSDAPIEAIKLTDFTQALAHAPGLARVVVIDGARANPYASQGDPLAGGLALVEPPPNTVVAFNAAPGSIGVEDSGDYGVYAKTLAGLLRQGGVDIADVLAETRLKVNQQTQGAQIPWSAGKFGSPYFLFERAAGAPPPKRVAARKPLKQLSAEDAYESVLETDRFEDYQEFLREHARSQQAKRIEAILAARREALFWRRTLDQNSPRAYWTYLKVYPRGPHSYDAGGRLDALSQRREPPPDFAVVEYDDLPPPPPREIIYADRPVYYFGGDDFGPPPPPPPRAYDYDEGDDDWRDLPPPPPPTVAGLLPALAIAIPLGIAARAYEGRPRPDGRAPDAAPPPRRPMGPPPLPRGVQAVAPIAPPPPRPVRAPGGAGEVHFVAPNAPVGGRPPAPVIHPAAEGEPAGGALRARPTPGGATPLPTPTNGEPTPGGGRRPRPTPGATPGEATPLPTPTNGEPTPGGGRRPRPTPGATPGEATPLPTPTNGEATPDGGRRPRPIPGATPGEATPLPTPTNGEATPGGKRPRPIPGATPLPTPTNGEPAPDGGKPRATGSGSDAGGAARPRRDHAPKGDATPDATPGDAARPRATPATTPAAGDPDATPKRARPPKDPALDKPAARPETPLRTRDPDAEPKPKAMNAPPRNAEPAARAETPRPAPRAEAPPPRAAEAPRPAPPPRAAEAPRPAPPPPRAAEAPRPAPAAAAACGHPGQPRC